ncbi:MAG: hypothetical protein ACJZ2K_04170 [Candidatus Poseidoniaceae archaeon]
MRRVGRQVASNGLMTLEAGVRRTCRNPKANAKAHAVYYAEDAIREDA